MKPFKTIDEQIEILKSRNLKFKNVDRAKRYLLDYNYYNVVNFYSKFFIDKKTNLYYDDVYFEDILEVHYFDKEIKTAIFEAIMDVERHFKSILAYNYCSIFRDDLSSYLKVETYNPKFISQAEDMKDKLTKIIIKNKDKKKPNSIKHYVNTHNSVPFWILVDYLSFGDVIYFYKYLSYKVQNAVAYDLSNFIKENLSRNDTKPVTAKLIQNIIWNIRELRNITAHNNILLGFKCSNDLPYYEELHERYNIRNTDNRQSVYSTIIAMQFFLSHNQYANLNNKIRKRVNKLKNKIPFTYFEKVITSLGFPDNWEKIDIIPYENIYSTK